MLSPPSVTGARSRDPEPSGSLAPAPRVKTCSSSCLSWLHPLRSWSLQQTRGGSCPNLRKYGLALQEVHAQGARSDRYRSRIEFDSDLPGAHFLDQQLSQALVV